MNLLTTLAIIKDMLPLVIGIMATIEEAIPGTGKGEQKLAAVREILEATDKFTGDTTITSIWPLLSKVIGIMVGVFNTTKVFNKE